MYFLIKGVLDGRQYDVLGGFFDVLLCGSLLELLVVIVSFLVETLGVLLD